jgi:hypothetical protein
MFMLCSTHVVRLQLGYDMWYSVPIFAAYGATRLQSVLSPVMTLNLAIP